VSVRNALVWGNTRRATDVSNVFGYFFAPAFGLGLTFTTAIAGDHGSWAAVVDDTLPVVETVVLSQLVVQAAKFGVARQRPGVHFDPPGPPQLEDNVSFFSGHAALTFGIATSAGLIAHRRHYRSEPWFWTIGGLFAMTASYLRIAADKHYLTDVLTGAVVGVGSGLTIPMLMERPDVQVVPTGSGAALVGWF
jgi:membrane-associated phospholipid phosphatase